MIFIAYFLKGGFMMWPLLAVSIIAMTIFVERLMYYKKASGSPQFVDSFLLKLNNNHVAEAVALAENSKGDAAYLITLCKNKKAQELATFIEMQANILIANYRNRLNYLSMTVTLAPLMGLLGTIFGMINAFNVFNLKAGEPMAITGGIGEALIATATGLLVAIISLIFHSYLANQLEKLITILEKVSYAFVDFKSRSEI